MRKIPGIFKRSASTRNDSTNLSPAYHRLGISTGPRRLILALCHFPRRLRGISVTNVLAAARALLTYYCITVGRQDVYDVPAYAGSRASPQS